MPGFEKEEDRHYLTVFAEPDGRFSVEACCGDSDAGMLHALRSVIAEYFVESNYVPEKPHGMLIDNDVWVPPITTMS